MASKSKLEKDELIIRAARQRGVSPEKFISDVRRLSSDRGMCAHSKEYFFRADNVRTLSEAARLSSGMSELEKLRTMIDEDFALFDRMVDILRRNVDDISLLTKTVAVLIKKVDKLEGKAA